MATLLQLHFAFNGPFGDAMAEQLKPLAESINQEPGFLWKVWTESEKNHEAGGIYLFTDEKSALAYLGHFITYASKSDPIRNAKRC